MSGQIRLRKAPCLSEQSSAAAAAALPGWLFRTLVGQVLKESIIDGEGAQLADELQRRGPDLVREHGGEHLPESAKRASKERTRHRTAITGHAATKGSRGLGSRLPGIGCDP